jgi:hypothetical protein
MRRRPSERADDVNIFETTFWPEDVLSVIDLLLVYSGRHDKLVRPLVSGSNKVRSHFQGRRSIHHRALKAAHSIVHFNHGLIDGRPYWYICDGEDVFNRLRGAGINPDTCEVGDPYLWSLTWYQLNAGVWPQFRMADQKRMAAKGFKPPAPAPITRVATRVKRDVMKKRGIERRAKEKEEAQKAKEPEQDFENEAPNYGTLLKEHHNRRDVIRMS